MKPLRAVPFLFTFANAHLGFLAILQALEGDINHAIYSIVLAGFMDMCDGRIARALGVTSLLGMELDSLADSISFCLAPCVIMYVWYPGVIGITGSLALTLYLCGGLYRLARFNLNASQQAEFFSGLPVPIAAGALVSIVLYHDWLAAHQCAFMFYKRMPFVLVVIVALLMVSRIPFPTFKTYYSFKKWYARYALVSFFLFFVWSFEKGYPLAFFGVWLYIIFGIVSAILHLRESIHQ